jgi:UDP-glucuronate decarboxylase
VQILKSLLVTGGTGFFGRALLRYLKKQDGLFDKITILSRNPHAFASKFPELLNIDYLDVVYGDVLVPSSLPVSQMFSHILHAAGDSTDGFKLTHLDRYEQIVHGTRNMLDYAVKCGTKRFLLTSSGGVYGPQPQYLEAIPETFAGMPDPLVAGHVYGVAKRQAEHLCALYWDQYGLETVIARCFAFVGEDLPVNAHFAIGNFIRDALLKSEITVGGDGTPLRSYMYQTDLAEWLFEILMKGASGRAYNVGSDEAISISELAYLVRDTLTPNKPVRIVGDKARDNAVRNRYIPDINRAYCELGLEVTVSLMDAIKRSAQVIKLQSAVSFIR